MKYTHRKCIGVTDSRLFIIIIRISSLLYNAKNVVDELRFDIIDQAVYPFSEETKMFEISKVKAGNINFFLFSKLL